MHRHATIMAILAFLSTPVLGSSYRHSMSGDNLAKDFFGGYEGERVLKLNAGSYSIAAETTVDCGQIDLNVNVGAMFESIKGQLQGLVNMWNDGKIARALPAVALARAYPTVYAFLTENNARIDEKLGLRYDMCRDIDKYLKSQASEGKKELQSRAQQECIKETVSSSVPLAVAIQQCKNKTGLPLVDFERQYNDARTHSSQKALKAIVNFAKRHNTNEGYNRIASILGEIKVSSSGYWEPMFDEQILYSDKVIDESIALAGGEDCKFQDYYTRSNAPNDPLEKAVWKVTKKYFKKEHNEYLNLMGNEDKRLCCQFLSRSIGAQASREFGIEIDGAMKAGFMHPRVPDDLKVEFEKRTERAVKGILLAAENTKAASIEESLDLLLTYGKLVQQKSELVGRRASAGKINQETSSKNAKACTDSLSCKIGRQ